MTPSPKTPESQAQPLSGQQSQPLMVDADPNCPCCHGTGVDGDVGKYGETMDIDCGCRFRHLSASPVAMQQETKEEQAACNHWPGQKRCEWCDLGHAVASHAEEVAPMEPTTLHMRISELSEQHGSLRQAAQALGVDPGYLSRLASGEKDNPSDELLAAMGLGRAITIYRLEATPSQPEVRQPDPDVLAMAEEANELRHYITNAFPNLQQREHILGIIDRLAERATRTQEGAQGHAVAFPTGPISSKPMGPLTDCELLELAAKAADIILPTGQEPSEMVACTDDGWGGWNPLTDDGDALRLAVKLRFQVDIFSNWPPFVEVWRENGHDPIWVEYDVDDSDLYDITRRAIVRAAAEIGRAS